MEVFYGVWQEYRRPLARDSPREAVSLSVLQDIGYWGLPGNLLKTLRAVASLSELPEMALYQMA